MQYNNLQFYQDCITQSETFMIVEQEPFEQCLSLPHVFSRKTHEKHPNITSFSVQRSFYNVNLEVNSKRQNVFDSVHLKSERYNKIECETNRQMNSFNSLRYSHRKSLGTEKSDQNELNNNQQQFLVPKQQKIKQHCIKNSLMNKLLFQHKKTNKLNFHDTRSQLFANFHKSSINIKQNDSHSPNKQLISLPNEKISALLSDRPYKKASSPLKCNIGRLKMAYNIKQLAKKNIHMNMSFQSHFLEDKQQQNERYYQNKPFTYNLKNISSMRSYQKPFTKTGLLKECARSANKLQRLTGIENQNKSSKRRTLLKISDCQNSSQNNLDTILSEESLIQSRQIDNRRRQLQCKFSKQDRQRKCQEKILQDLVRLEQIKNKQFLPESKSIQSKSSRIFAQNLKQVKLLIKDKTHSNHEKIKYVVKFKTEPRQRPKQKLETKINSLLPEASNLRKKLLEKSEAMISQISGFAQQLKQRPVQTIDKSVRESVKELAKERRTMPQKLQYNFSQKEFTGWDIQRETQGRDNWNFTQ